MNTNLALRATKVVAAAAISLTLGVGLSGTASASTSHVQHHSRGHDNGVGKGRHDNGDWNSLRGTVTAFDSTANTITVEGRHGVPVVYTTTTSTTYAIGTTAATASDIVVGEHVVLSLTTTTPPTVASVTILLSRVRGTVTAINGTVLTIAGHHGSSLSVNTSPTTTYTLGGAPSTFTAITVGSKIVAAGLPDSAPSTLDATKIWIKAPCTHVQGIVTAVDPTANTITVGGHRGVPVAYTTTDTTTYFAGTTAVDASVVMVGERVTLTLTTTSPQTVTNVLIHLDAIVGTVSAITGSVLTVNGHWGTTWTVNTSPTTTYSQGGSPSSFAAITVGTPIAALGLPDAAPSTLDASAVYLFVGGFGHFGGGSYGHHGAFSPRGGFGHHSRR